METLLRFKVRRVLIWYRDESELCKGVWDVQESWVDNKIFDLLYCRSKTYTVYARVDETSYSYYWFENILRYVIYDW